MNALIQWFRQVLAKYALFRGRARRREYWRFVLYYLLCYAALLVVDLLTGTFSFESQRGLLGGLFLLFMFIPALAVAVRRLHDTGRSGWWLLLAVIPLVGQLVLLYFFIDEGDEGDNDYGPDPKARA